MIAKLHVLVRDAVALKQTSTMQLYLKYIPTQGHSDADQHNHVFQS